MVEAFLKASGRNYSSRAIARGIAEDPRIEEPPSPRTVLRALHICEETRGTVVRNQFLRGGDWCHVDDYQDILEEKRQMEAVEKGGTTKPEDRLAVPLEKGIREAETTAPDRPYHVNPFLRRFFEALGIEERRRTWWQRLFDTRYYELTVEAESVEPVLRAVMLAFAPTEGARETVRRSWETFERWRRKPEG